MKDREDKITARRRQQPIEELERKWEKAKGRWSNRYWAVEWLDLAEVRGRQLLAKMRW